MIPKDATVHSLCCYLTIRSLRPYSPSHLTESDVQDIWLKILSRFTDAAYMGTWLQRLYAILQFLHFAEQWFSFVLQYVMALTKKGGMNCCKETNVMSLICCDFCSSHHTASLLSPTLFIRNLRMLNVVFFAPKFDSY